MEVNFDKQIDTILRDLAKGNLVGESPPHLDADELSAFAENALPPKARLRAMEHLVDCQKCRKTLSTFVSLANVESETIHEEVKTVAEIPEIPWYRRLFAFPNLSYVMGAMAFVLVGMVGILLWQGAQDQQSKVAKIETVEEKAKGPSGLSSEGESPTSETHSTNSANATSNTAAPASNTVPHTANSTANTVSPIEESKIPSEPSKPMATPAVVGNSTSSDTPVMDKAGEEARDRKTVAKEDAEEKNKKGASKQPENEVSTGGEAPERQQTDDPTNLATQRAEVPAQNRAVQNNTIYPDGPTRSGAPPPPAPGRRSVPRDSETTSKDEEKKNKAESKSASPTRSVAGKTFTNVNGIWTDSSYRGGNTINVRRGTGAYKKLDSGLRSTADYLGGTVIIVWKDQNYKIQ